MKADFVKGYRAAAGKAVKAAEARKACNAFLAALDKSAKAAVGHDPWSAGRALWNTAGGNGNWFARDFGDEAGKLAALARGEG